MSAGSLHAHRFVFLAGALVAMHNQKDASPPQREFLDRLKHFTPRTTDELFRLIPSSLPEDSSGIGGTAESVTDDRQEQDTLFLAATFLALLGAPPTQAQQWFLDLCMVMKPAVPSDVRQLLHEAEGAQQAFKDGKPTWLQSHLRRRPS